MENKNRIQNRDIGSYTNQSSTNHARACTQRGFHALILNSHATIGDGCLIPRRRGLMATSDGLTRSRCACFGVKILVSSTNKRCLSLRSAFERLLLLSRRFEVEVRVMNAPLPRMMAWLDSYDQDMRSPSAIMT